MTPLGCLTALERTKFVFGWGHPSPISTLSTPPAYRAQHLRHLACKHSLRRFLRMSLLTSLHP